MTSFVTMAGQKIAQIGAGLTDAGASHALGAKGALSRELRIASGNPDDLAKAGAEDGGSSPDYPSDTDSASGRGGQGDAGRPTLHAMLQKSSKAMSITTSRIVSNIKTQPQCPGPQPPPRKSSTITSPSEMKRNGDVTKTFKMTSHDVCMENGTTDDSAVIANSKIESIHREDNFLSNAMRQDDVPYYADEKVQTEGDGVTLLCRGQTMGDSNGPRFNGCGGSEGGRSWSELNSPETPSPHHQTSDGLTGCRTCDQKARLISRSHGDNTRRYNTSLSHESPVWLRRDYTEHTDLVSADRMKTNYSTVVSLRVMGRKEEAKVEYVGETSSKRSFARWLTFYKASKNSTQSRLLDFGNADLAREKSRLIQQNSSPLLSTANSSPRNVADKQGESIELQESTRRFRFHILSQTSHSVDFSPTKTLQTPPTLPPPQGAAVPPAPFYAALPSTRRGVENNSSQGASAQKSRSANRAKKALRTITIILGAFVCCWTPWHVLSMMIGFCDTLPSDCVSTLLYDVSYWLCYLNSPINPFCYALANQQFKKAFIRILRFDWHRT